MAGVEHLRPHGMSQTIICTALRPNIRNDVMGTEGLPKGSSVLFQIAKSTRDEIEGEMACKQFMFPIETATLSMSPPIQHTDGNCTAHSIGIVPHPHIGSRRIWPGRGFAKIARLDAVNVCNAEYPRSVLWNGQSWQFKLLETDYED